MRRRRTSIPAWVRDLLKPPEPVGGTRTKRRKRSSLWLMAREFEKAEKRPGYDGTKEHPGRQIEPRRRKGSIAAFLKRLAAAPEPPAAEAPATELAATAGPETVEAQLRRRSLAQEARRASNAPLPQSLPPRPAAAAVTFASDDRPLDDLEC